MRIIIHWNGCSYYYALETGRQVSKSYKKLGNLKRFGKIYEHTK